MQAPLRALLLVNALAEEKRLVMNGGGYEDLDEHDKEPLRQFWDRGAGSCCVPLCCYGSRCLPLTPNLPCHSVMK